MLSQVENDIKAWDAIVDHRTGTQGDHDTARWLVEQACNVRVVIPGQDRRRPPLVIMTPRSAWWTCTAERCGGIASWLACLRHFANRPPARDVIFIANTGHELSHLGLEQFLAHHGPLVARAHAWIHLGANFAARGSRLRWQASEPGWLSRGSAALEALGHEVQLNPATVRPLGEARNIFDAGGRFVSLLGDNRWFHNPADRWPAAVDLEQCEALVDFVLALAVDLARP